jgi:hypothetical protein
MEGEPTPSKQGSEEETRPQFERVTEVLGPLEQIVLAADQEIGTIQERVDSEGAEASTRIEKRVREAAMEQRRRVIEMRKELTNRASELATHFETMLNMLDQAERQLTLQGLPEGEPGDRAGEARITVTERSRLTISHEGPPTEQASTKPPPVVSAQAKAASGQEKEEPKGIRRLFRRFRGSAA